MKNFRQIKMSVLRRELKEIGLSMSEARRLNKKDERILFVTGKLLINYPVSFDLPFIFDHLDLPIGDRCLTRTKSLNAYYQGLRQRA